VIAASGPTVERRLRIVVAILALAGVGVAGYLTWVHYAGLEPICAGGSGGCEKVQGSHYAELAGVPVALLGLIGYAVILASLALPGEAGRTAGAAGGAGGLRVQRLADLRGAVRDRRDLPVVRRERADHDRAGAGHRDPPGACRSR
jgi:hypothetical protein